MAWVYILKGSNGRFYIGSTADLARRLEEHRRGSCHTTKRLGEGLEVIFSLEISSTEEARALERKLKSFKNPSKALRHLEILSGR